MPLGWNHWLAAPSRTSILISRSKASDPSITKSPTISTKERLITRLTGLFGLLALALASVGLYGITAYSVARRTSEIGLRMALGANRGDVVALVLRKALLLVALGLAIGVPVALLGGRLMASQLYGVRPYDPISLAAAVLLLSAFAALAGFIPARRAASIEPMNALRTE